MSSITNTKIASTPLAGATSLVPVKTPNYWQNKTNSDNKKFHEVIDDVLPLPSVLIDIVFEYYRNEKVVSFEILPFDADIKTKSVYAIYFNKGYVLFQHIQNRRPVKDGVPVLYFGSQGSDAPSFSIKEDAPKDKVIPKRMRFETDGFSSTTPKYLKFSHTELDNLRSYTLETIVPTDFPTDSRPEIWELVHKDDKDRAPQRVEPARRKYEDRPEGKGDL